MARSNEYQVAERKKNKSKSSRKKEGFISSKVIEGKERIDGSATEEERKSRLKG